MHIFNSSIPQPWSNPKKFGAISFCLFSGGVAFWACCEFVPLILWKDVKIGLFLVLGIFLTAALLRITRPFPLMNPDNFENLKEINDWEKTYLRMTKDNVYFLFMTGGAILLIIGIILFTGFFSEETGGKLSPKAQSILSGLIGFIITYFTITAAFGMIQFDLWLIKVHAHGVRIAFANRKRTYPEQNNQP